MAHRKVTVRNRGLKDNLNFLILFLIILTLTHYKQSDIDAIMPPTEQQPAPAVPRAVQKEKLSQLWVFFFCLTFNLGSELPIRLQRQY